MRKIVFIILLTVIGAAFAKEGSKLEPIKTQKEIKVLMSQNKLREAENLAIRLVLDNPGNSDSQVLLAFVYYKEQDYDSCKTLLENAKKKFPNNPDIPDLEELLKQALNKQKGDVIKYNNPIVPVVIAATNMKKEEVAQKSTPAEGQVAQEGAVAEGVMPRSASVFAPTNLQSTNILNSILSEYAQKYGPNQLGINQQSIYATSPDGYWDFSSLYYTRETDWGMFLGTVNYASRIGHGAFQGTAEAVVNLSEKFYVDLNFGYANNLYIFPDYSVGAEGYISIFRGLQISFGDLYRAVTPTYFNTYTSSLQYYMGDYLFVFRPYFYVPQSGTNSVLYTGSIRKYLGTTDHSIVATVGYGEAPDIADLQSLNFIVLKDRSVALTYEFPIVDHRFIIDLGLSYENQRFPSGIIRQLTGVDVGIRARF